MKAINWAAIGTLLAALVLVAPAEAGPATEQLQTQIDSVFKALADPDLKGPEKAEQRRAIVLAAAEDIFDFGHTAKLTLGTYWEQLTPKQREEFVDLFKGFIGKSYLSNVDIGDGQKFVYTGETVEGNRATVRSQITTSGGSSLGVDFRMIQGDSGKWRLYDVNFEGMSLVANYRQQFTRVIKASSYDDLVGKLRAKQGATAASGQ
jgi:phospholipid transport system substrate-binding protein